MMALLVAVTAMACSDAGSGPTSSGADGALADVDDVSDDRDAAPLPDVSQDPADDSEAGGAPCAVAACVPPCVFSFRDIADDRDGLREVRLGAVGGTASIVAIELVDAPEWVTFSNRFGDYLSRISGGSWSIDTTLRFVSEGDPISIPDGESVAIELRADDPGAASCPSGACGAVRVHVGDCASGATPVELPIAR